MASHPKAPPASHFGVHGTGIALFCPRFAGGLLAAAGSQLTMAGLLPAYWDGNLKAVIFTYPTSTPDTDCML